MPAVTKTRVLLVGAGRRAQATIIPALYCMRPWLDLTAVHTRTAREVILLGGKFRMTTRSDLSDVDPGSVDAVIVAVGLRQVPAVLRSLEPIADRHMTLMLDTPVLDLRDLRATRHFSRYKHVLASEDSFALPPYVLARRLIADGAIGRPRHVYLFHSGYRYHALASLKQLTGAPHPTRISVKRWNRWCARVTARFPGGVKLTIVEPRRYDSGRILIVGDRGFIVDYPIGHRNATEVGYRIDDERYAGLTVDGDPVPPSEQDRALSDGLRREDLVDPSRMNLLKIRGFMDLLTGLGDATSDWRYSAYDSIQDSVSLRIAERLGHLKDVRIGRRTTIVGGTIRAAAGVARVVPKRSG